MRLYHGSNQYVTAIDLKKGKAYKEEYGDAYESPENLSKLALQLRFPGTEYVQYCFCTKKGVEQLILDM